jgi:hypothetical protein
MTTLTEKQLTRIALWNMMLGGNKDRKVEANVQSTFYGKAARYPEAVPSQVQAREWLSKIAQQCRTFASRYWGECDLTDQDISIGTEIYYIKDKVKLTLIKCDVDAIIG